MFNRYALICCLAAYIGTILVLHGLGIFPRAGLYDLSRLFGAPVTTLEGQVLDNPVIRWNQTRFLMNARADPLNAFNGNVFVTLPYPDESLAPGDILRIRGWLTTPRSHTQSYWASRRVFAFFRVWSEESVTKIQPASAWSLRFLAWRFHRSFRAFWEERLPRDESALLIGVTVGARGLLPPAVKDACIRAGVYHIVVVSGQNMSFIVGLGITLLLALTFPRRHAFWVCVLPILFYTSVAGGDPPVLRAAATALVGLVAGTLGRDMPRFYPVSLAAFWILLCDPAALLGASFQLSFGATLCIMAWLPYWQEVRDHAAAWRRWLQESVLLGLAVYIGIGPVLIHYFHQISLVGLVANVTIFPLSSLLMVMGLLVGMWGTLIPESVPFWLVRATEYAVRGTLWVIQKMADVPWAVVKIEPLSPWVIALYYGTLFGILLVIHRRKTNEINRPRIQRG